MLYFHSLDSSSESSESSSSSSPTTSDASDDERYYRNVSHDVEYQSSMMQNLQRKRIIAEQREREHVSDNYDINF